MERRRYTEGKKYSSIPPILIRSDSFSEEQGSSESARIPGNPELLPPINPHGYILTGNASFVVPEQGFVIKQEPQDNFSTNGMLYNSEPSALTPPRFPGREPPNSLNLHKQKFSYNSTVNSNFLQLPPIPQFNSRSALISDINTQPGNLWSPTKTNEVNIKIPSKVKLPSLVGTHSIDGGDDEVSSIIPPLHSLSPYIGSGISDVPSFPSILNSPTTSAHLQRKRALSTSPYSDLSAFQSSPSSSVQPALNQSSNAFAPINNHVHALHNSNNNGHFRVQKRKMSIEQNQDNSGAVRTTITNQITYKEQNSHGHVAPMKNPNSTEPMDQDSFSGSESIARSNTDGDFLSEILDPHICMWEGCGQAFDEMQDLVQHIEVAHIEKGRSDDYVCLWDHCVRARKPFNARYKLLIHMRIHSGEKPNKCTVSKTI